MTFRLLAGVLAAGAVLAVSPAASAQGRDPFTTGYLNINFGVQSSSNDLTDSGSFPLYDEQATFDSLSEVKGGGFVEVGGGVRVWRNVYVGVAWSRVTDEGDAVITAQVPDPLFYDRFRSASGTASGLEHTEQAIHLHAVWRQRVTETFDVSVSFGPTIFSVDQSLVSGMTFNESAAGPVLAGVTLSEASESAVGFNFGVDGTYLFSPRLGAGAFLRYTGGSVDLPVSGGGTTSLDVGGFQIGAGLRVRF